MPESAQERMTELVSHAWAEARGMAGAGREHRHRAPGETAAAALRAHGALCTGLGRSVPVTSLAARPGVRDLAVFLAVYAAQGAPAAATGRGAPKRPAWTSAREALEDPPGADAPGRAAL
ncbi:hypothetical protein [Streptomyces violascens]|uniref:hypothetical protein n=1 Tax=Streptomyces violascens TaxID=67381 RepID=UPI0036C92D31